MTKMQLQAKLANAQDDVLKARKFEAEAWELYREAQQSVKAARAVEKALFEELVVSHA